MTPLDEALSLVHWTHVVSAFDRWEFAFAGLLVICLWAFGRLPSASAGESSRRHTARIAGGVVVLAVGAFRVLDRAFLCDDAFISFRYARNLASGHGLVWNVGERVEGYTNFLYTALLGGVARLGADIPLAALVLDVSAYFGCVVLAVLVVRDARPHATSKVEWPVAATVLALARPMTTFATSGLETMVATFATLALLWRVVRGTSPACVGVLAGLLAMIRPDHALFALGAAAAAAVRGPSARSPCGPRYAHLRRAWGVLVTFGLVFGTYFVLRAAYYGDLVPNTFRAKSGDASYWSRGALYGVHFLVTTGTWLGLPVVVHASRVATRLGASLSLLRARAFVWVGASLLALYVLRVGGDFMEHRFLVTPFACLVVLGELEIRAVLDERVPPPRGARARIALAALTVGVTTLPIRPIPPGEKALGLAAEETFYPLVRSPRTSLLPAYPLRVACTYEAWAERLVHAFAGQVRPPTLAFGSIGILGYRTGFPIVDVLGLTDRRVASRPLVHRGRPGHERLASLEDAAVSGAEFWLDAPAERTHPAARFTVAGLSATLLSASPRTERSLAAIGVDVDAIHGAIARASADPSRSERLDVGRFVRLLYAREPRYVDHVARLDASLRSIAEFDGTRPVPDGARDVRGCEAASSPIGLGTGALELGAHALVTWRLSPGADEVRMRAFAYASDSFRVEVLDEQGIVDAYVLREGPQLVALRLPRATTGAGVLRVRGLGRPGARGFVDSIHLSDPAERTLAAWHDWEDPDARLDRYLRLVDALPSDDERLVGLRRAFAFTRGFEPGESGTAAGVGHAFGVLHAVRAEGQGTVHGAIGVGHLSGYIHGDGPHGRWRERLGTSGPATISFRLAGGSDCERLRVELRAGESLLEVVCGAGDERFHGHRLRVEHDLGQELSLSVIDESSGGYGHLMLDEVLVQELPASPSMARTGPHLPGR